jgi:hypothetical protein
MCICDRSYVGDDNNNSAIDEGGKKEQQTVSPASPTLISTASPSSTTLGANVAILTDSATLTGGYYETGNITFTLTAPGGGVVDKETVPVHRDGTYSTPNGYTPTVAGVYQWLATYEGDDNNLTAQDEGGPPEQATVYLVISGSKFDDRTENGFSADDPKLGTSDLNYQGGITVNLYNNGTFVTSTVTDSNGDYSFGGLLPGNYSVSEVVPTGWKQTATRGAAATTPGTFFNNNSTCNDFDNFKYGSISGIKYHDLTGNGFSGDDPVLSSSTQSVTFQLFKNGSLIATSSQNTSGVFSFNNLDYGTYYIQEVVPTNWVLTANQGATRGPSGNGFVVITSGVSSTGNDFDNAHVNSPNGNPRTKGYWANNGRSSITQADINFLNTLYLRNLNGTRFTITGTTLAAEQNNLSNFLLGANSNNPANQLSAQLVAMELNVRHGGVNGASVIYEPGLWAYRNVSLNGVSGPGAIYMNVYNGGFITVNDLMAAASTTMQYYYQAANSAAAGFMATGSTYYGFENAMETALDHGNNNLNFVI